jgi:undecaprenyl-diphosphatase
MASPSAIVLRGLCVAASLASGFAALALGVTFESGWILEVDRGIAAAVRSLPAAVGEASALAARLGDPRPALVAGLAVAVGFALSRRWLYLSAWMAALVGNGVWTWALKRLLARARPVDADGVAMSATFSFPSAHSAGLLVACGLLAYLLTRSRPARRMVPAVAAAVLFASAVGAGRVLLGYHHASDVLAGFLSGGIWLTACIVAVELARRRAPGPPTTPLPRPKPLASA